MVKLRDVKIDTSASSVTINETHLKNGRAKAKFKIKIVYVSAVIVVYLLVAGIVQTIMWIF